MGHDLCVYQLLSSTTVSGLNFLSTHGSLLRWLDQHTNLGNVILLKQSNGKINNGLPPQDY